MAHQDLVHVIEMIPLSPGDTQVERGRVRFRGMVEVRNVVPDLSTLYPPRRTRIRCDYIMHIPEGYELVRRITAPPPSVPPPRPPRVVSGTPTPIPSAPSRSHSERPGVSGPSSAAPYGQVGQGSGGTEWPYFYGEDRYGRVTPPVSSQGAGPSRVRPRDSSVPRDGRPLDYTLGVRNIHSDESEDDDSTPYQPHPKAGRCFHPIPVYTPSAAGTPDDPIDLREDAVKEEEEEEEEDPREDSY